MLFYLALFYKAFTARFRKPAKPAYVVTRNDDLRQLLIKATQAAQESTPKAEITAIEPSIAPPTFMEEFSTQELPRLYWERWALSDWAVPGACDEEHFSIFVPSLVTPGIEIAVKQEAPEEKICSYGGEIKSLAKLGPGTFTWEAQMPKPVSGSVATLGLILNNGQVEISFETCGNRPDEVCCSNFVGLAIQNVAFGDNEWVPFGDLSDDFHKFQLVWTRGQLDFYIDDVPVYSTQDHVPNTPANVVINHYGSNAEWGGKAMFNVERVLRVRRFSYIPA